MPTCPLCKSKKFSRRDGLLVCQYGHQLNIQQQQSDGEVMGGTRQFKRKKTARNLLPEGYVQVRKKTSSQVPKHLVYEIFQYGLKYQVEQCIQQLGFSQDLQDVILELWLLLVTKCQVHFVYRSKLGKNRQRRLSRSASAGSYSSMSDSASYSGSDWTSNYSAEYDHVIMDEEGTAFDLDEALEKEQGDQLELQDYDSCSTDSLQRQKKAYAKRDLFVFKESQKARKEDITRKVFPLYSLVLIYIGCQYMRYPVTLADIYRWANHGVIPYLSAFAHLPPYLVQELSNKKASVFPAGRTKSESIPSMFALRQYTKFMLGFYHSEYEMVLPPMNVPLMRLRLVSDIGLPEQFYILSCVLSEIWHGCKTPIKPIEAAKQNKSNTFLSGQAIYLNDWDYCRIAATLFIVCKLVYGLDGTLRYDDDYYPFLANIPSMRNWMDFLLRKRPFLSGFARWGYQEWSMILDENIKQEYCKFLRQEIVPVDAKDKKMQEAYVVSSEPSSPIDPLILQAQTPPDIQPIPKSEFEAESSLSIGSEYLRFHPPSEKEREDALEYPTPYALLLAWLSEYGGVSQPDLEKAVRSLEEELEIEHIADVLL